MPPRPSAPIAQDPCNWLGFNFLAVVKAIDLWPELVRLVHLCVQCLSRDLRLCPWEKKERKSLLLCGSKKELGDNVEEPMAVPWGSCLTWSVRIHF